MSRKKQEYTTQFEEEYKNINSAVLIAGKKQASMIATSLENLSKAINTAGQVEGTDSPSNSVRETAETIANSLLDLSSASDKYAKEVENKYNSPFQEQLNELKKGEEEYNALFDKEPTKEKYKEHRYNPITRVTEEILDRRAYHSALDEWNRIIDDYEQQLNSICENIEQIKFQLSAAGNADIASVAKDGFSLRMPSVITFEAQESVFNDYENGDEAISPYIYDRLLGYGYYDVRLLDGDELQQYMNEYGIGPNEYWGYNVYGYDNGEYGVVGSMSAEEARKKYNFDLSVYVGKKKVNGVEFEFAFVYDNNKDDQFHQTFEKRMENALKEMELIPSSCLKEIQDKHRTLIKQNEDPICDSWSSIDSNGDMNYRGAAYNVPNALARHYYSNDGDDFGEGAILHEMGHAYDRNRDSNSECASGMPDQHGDQWIKITGDEVNPFLHTFAPGYDDVDWDNLTDDRKISYTKEHFANCFREYCRNPDAFKTACPESYAAIDALIQETERNY